MTSGRGSHPCRARASCMRWEEHLPSGTPLLPGLEGAAVVVQQELIIGFIRRGGGLPLAVLEHPLQGIHQGLVMGSIRRYYLHFLVSSISRKPSSFSRSSSSVTKVGSRTSISMTSIGMPAFSRRASLIIL